MDYAEGWTIERIKPIPLPISKAEILNLPKQYELDDLQQSLIYFLYLTGARVSEALATSPSDIHLETLQDGSEALTIQLLTLKNRRLAKFGKPYRILPIPLSQPIEKQMAKTLLKHSQYYQATGQKLLFPFSRKTAWKTCTKIQVQTKAIILEPNRKLIDYPNFKTNPHYYRHCRLTDLVKDYNYDSLRLQLFAGWTTLEPAKVYVSINWRDLLKPML